MKTIIYQDPPDDFRATIQCSICFCEYNNKILIGKRQPSRPQGEKWGLPGGKFEPGETPEEAVIREVFEEAGLDIKEGLQKINTIYIRMPHLDYANHIFVKRFDTLPQIQLATEEHSQMIWATIEEALTLPLLAGGSEILALYRKFRFL